MAKILVVDDSEELCDLFHLLLSMKGYECETVHTKSKLHNTMTAFVPDLIILDVTVNGIDGRELCKEIRLNNQHKHIPIILASTNPKMLEEYNGCDADGTIEKPFAINYVIQKIEELLPEAHKTAQ